MIRSPTRTKTESFNGPQYSFKFPSMECLPSTVLPYDLNNHHLLNEQISKKNEDDAHSQILSDYTTSNSNSADSSNGYYSFANISDNTTNRERLSVRGQNKASTRYSYISSGSSAHYPLTLAPERDSKIHLGSSPEIGKIMDSSPNMSSIPEGYSSVTSNFTLPTADNVSVQFSLYSESSTAQLKKQKTTLSKSYSLTRRVHSVRRSESTHSNRSKLKRSNAIRCKGGLLQYFTNIGRRIEKAFSKLHVALKKKLFTYKQRSIGKKNNNNKKRTTSHLLRSNGYLSNIKRSQSMRSINNGSKTSPLTVPSDVEISNTPIVTQSSSTTRRSLRRTPSSIKRAASILTNSNSFIGSRSTSSLLRSGSTRLVRSQPSLNLNSAVRQPSIVVNNKVIPLSKFDHASYCIREEDEEEGQDEYVIDTQKMQPLETDDSSIVSSLLNESQYEDADEYSDSVISLSDSVKAQNARKAWDSYLRLVISQRIMMRLQISKFQQSQDSAVYKELIEAISTDYESDQVFSHTETLTEAESPFEEESLDEMEGLSNSIQSTPLMDPQS